MVGLVIYSRRGLEIYFCIQKGRKVEVHIKIIMPIVDEEAVELRGKD